MRIFGYKLLKQKELDNVFFNKENAIQYFFNNTNPLIFDVGANVGQSIEFFLKQFKNPTIYSFEPSSAAFDILKTKYSTLGNVILHKNAVGAAKTQMQLNCYSDSALNSFFKINTDSNLIKENIYSRVKNSLLKTKEPAIEIVDVISLDDFVSDAKIEHINILKIDVEGFESDVLSGASGLLKDYFVDMIIVEIHFDDIFNKSSSFCEIESLLCNNYLLWDISHVFKDLKKGKTCWVDAIYVSKKLAEKKA